MSSSLASSILSGRPRPRRRPTRFVILLVTVVLLGNAIVGERGLVALLRADREFATLSRAIGALRAENDDLRVQVRALREEPQTIEELARRDLGLIEPGEILFIVSDGGTSRLRPAPPGPVPRSSVLPPE